MGDLRLNTVLTSSSWWMIFLANLLQSNSFTVVRRHLQELLKTYRSWRKMRNRSADPQTYTCRQFREATVTQMIITQLHYENPSKDHSKNALCSLHQIGLQLLSISAEVTWVGMIRG